MNRSLLSGCTRTLLLAWAFGMPFESAASQRASDGAAILSWPVVTRDAKPWTRWWWMGSAVDEKTLNAELRALRPLRA